jgi:hypothetical protein
LDEMALFLDKEVMNPIPFVVIGLVLLLVLYLFLSGSGGKPTGVYTIVEGSVPGDKETTNTMLLPPSFNQPEGAVFSYSGWLLINDFTAGYGRKRRIFSKGDAPGLYIDSTSNSLEIDVKTYGTTETILIQNIPALKWIHFAIVVDQYSVDIYINGTLRQHHTLSQLPDQSDEPVKIGPGWNGVLGKLTYYPRKLTNADANTLASEKPPSDLRRPTSSPQYFDISWYTGRLNSSE